MPNGTDATASHELPFHLQSLADIGQSGGGNVKPVLFRVMSDMFVSKSSHTADEMAQFQEMAVAMIGDIDSETLAVAAYKLAQHPATPAAVLERLLRADEKAAAAVLQHGAHVSREILIDVAKWGDCALACALARRKTADDELMRLLMERPEAEVLQALVENPSVKIPAALAQSLVRRALGHPDLAAALVRRSDIDADMTALYLFASTERRANLLLAARRIDLGNFSEIRLGAGEAAALLRLERLAFEGNRDAFDQALGMALACPVELAHRLANDPSGDALAIALAAIGMAPASTARVFMSLDASIAHSVERVHALTALVSSLSQQAARSIIAHITGRSKWTLLRAMPQVVSHRALPSRAQAEGTALPRSAGEIQSRAQQA